VIALEYHDVVRRDARDASGFPGPAAGSYKLLASDFDAHLRAVSAVVPRRLTVQDVLEGRVDRRGVLLTFDDGGCSAHSVIADRLEAHGWRGHFFVPTDYIGHPAFLTPAQIRELHRRGHVIGSHSCSHPLRMARCTWPQLLREWSLSVHVLADLLGVPVVVASVPGGMTSARVIEAAAAAGIRALFTSEPVTRPATRGSCLVLGRFTLRSGSSASLAARLASGRFAPRAVQWTTWNVKAVLKRVATPVYDRVRARLLDGRPDDAG
jgi:peptidoglycan/xylan/chitin deacetylase (PgdA/CDA1 family)